MRYIKLGKSDLKVSVIGLGTGQFGCRAWGYGIRYDDKKIVEIVKHAIEYGINVFDTAEIYGDGLSEKLLGEALKGYDREDFIIISKVAPWNLSYAYVLKAAEKSLQRLNVKFIDLYLVHYPNPFIPLRQTFKAMERLVKEGKVRYIGVSNFGCYLLRKAQENLSCTEIVANEIEYNLFSRRAEKRIIPYCIKQGIGIIAYSPLAGGILSGHYLPNRLPKDRARAFNFYARNSFIKKAYPLLQLLREIAKEKGVSVAQIALAWIIKNPGFIAIPAAITLKQVKENALASDLTLSPKDIQRINENLVDLGIPTYLFDHYVIRPISWTKEAIKHLFLRK